MLRLYRGSQLELLAEKLIKLYTEQPLDDVLAKEIVVVQNHGMARWLSTSIARESGIAANLSFEFPAERVWDTYRCMDEDIPKDLPSDREPMTWTIYQLLEGLPETSPYLAAWNYVRDNDDRWNPLKAWKLANRIGDLFDQYLVYRPGMLLKWENDKRLGLGSAEAWQAGLWHKLNVKWDETFTEIQWNHRAGIHSSFMELIKEGRVSPEGLPQRITLFGLSGLPESSIELFVGLSGVIDIEWFWLYTTNDKTFEPLRESWGSEGEEFLHLFKKHTSRNDISVREITVENEATKEESDAQTLDLFDPTGYPPFNIEIHSCHSPLREVEVLHNNLLEVFEKNPELEPDDILILCPDIATYTPFIQAVFGTTENDLPSIAYHIVDDHTGIRKEVFSTFSKLLALLESRFKVTEVLDLLSTRIVRERFDITEDELERMQHWIKETKVRWGLSGEDKRQMDMPGSERFTWMAGLDRMMLGFSSQIEDEIFEGIYPYGQIESSEDAALLGKLSRFLNELSRARRSICKPQKPQEWVSLLGQWIESFIPANDEYYRTFQGLSALVSGMESATELAGYEKELDFSVILDYLENRLTGEAARGGYFGHGITFSGMDQMRNIPSKVVGMIGMNNEAFPRNKVSPDFDLVTQNPQKGDRLQRNDDRYLFLEAMQSARDFFYLSYVGQSNRDDSSRPPSVMISELMDHLEEQGMKRENLLVEHPLQPYSSRYFKNKNGNTRLFSYSPNAYNVHHRLSMNKTGDRKITFLEESEVLSEADESYKQISINDLVRFYEHPARFLVEQRLGIRFREEEVISEDREPFQLRGLEGYKLGEELMMRRLNGKEIAGFEPIAHAKGMLPEGWPGHQEFLDKMEETSEFSAAAGKLLDKPKLDRQEVSLEFGDFHLTGVLDSLHTNYQLFIRYGTLRPKDLVKLWIYHLVLLQIPDLDHSYESLLLSKKENKPGYNLFGPVENSRNLLLSLIQHFWTGIHKKIPLFPDSSFSFAHEIVVKGEEENEALGKAMNKWEKTWRPDLSEKEDPYNKLLYDNSYSFGGQEFKSISLEIWKPVFNSLKEEDIFE